MRGRLLLIIVVIAYGITRGAAAVARWPGFPTAEQRKAPTRGTSNARSHIWRGLAVLGLAAIAIAGIDWLGAAASPQVTTYNGHWWGSVQESPWSAAAGHGTFMSRHLIITINGDELTAAYAVTAAAGNPVARIAESDTGNNAGNDLVDNLLGDVLVGESHYGFTGHELASYQLTFKAPKLQIASDKNKHLIAKLDIESYPFRLYLHRQQITILPPSKGSVGSPITATAVAPSVQIANPVGIEVRSIANGMANLRIKQATAPDAGSASFLVSEGDTSPTWFDGLRAVGKIIIPIADWFFFRMSNLFIYAVLLWAFYRARRVFPDNQLVIVGLQTVQTVVVALAAVAVLGFASDLGWKLAASGASDRGFLQAGPLGLLVGGATVVWPLACWRAGVLGSGDRTSGRHPSRPASERSRWRRAVVPVLVPLIVVALYWVRLHQLGVNPLTSVPVIAGTALVLVVLPLLVRLLLGRGGLLSWMASAGFLAAALAAAASWPLLFPTSSGGLGSAHVNIWGKWTYVTVALAAAAGLCVMWGRIAWRMLRRSHQRSRTVPVLVVTAVIAVIVASIVPDAVSESGVASPHVTGLVPSDLFGLFDAVLQLVDWLLLVLAIVVIMRLPPRPDPRPVARDLALPVALMLLYWSDRWLYLPITAIAGIFLIRRLMMPSELAHVASRDACPETQVQDAASGWRQAEFLAGQQQALATSSTDALRDSVLNGKAGEFQSRLARLARAQDELAAKRHAYQIAARSAKVEAFSHKGEAADLRSAAIGSITGAVLGVIPATITLLISQPLAANNSYPILGFFGVTAWNVLTWAGLGWFIGYFLPLIRGASGAEKAMWIFIAGTIGSLPASLIWNDAHDWVATLVNDLEFLVFLMVVTVIVCDLRILWRAGLRPTDWVRVHNWRFVASWSAALIAAIGTIAITFATTTVTDLSQQLTRQPPSASGHP